MQIKTVLWITAFGLGLIFSLASCKKDQSQTNARHFDPKIDGIAVYPLPAMDAQLARRINRDGPVLPTTDITPSYEGGALPAPAEEGPSVVTPAPGPTPGPISPMAPATQPQPRYDYGDDDIADSNSP